jgi:signal transduction histidine kinase
MERAMATSFRNNLIVIAALAALACVGAIGALWYLAQTTADQRAARAEDNVTLEAERVRDVVEALPRPERALRGRHQGELRSGYVDDVARADRSPLVMEAVARAHEAQGPVTFSGTTEGGTPAAVSAVPVPGGGYAFAIRRVVTGRETRTLRDAVMALSLLSVLLVVVSLWTVVAVERGVSTLRGALVAVAKDLRAPVARPRVRELGDIADGLSNLAQELARAQTERERLTAELSARERLAALGRVAAGVAHEVRNPLAAMKLRADLARTGGEATPAVARDLEDIASEIARLDRLVSDLLVVAGRRSGPKAEVDLGDLVARRASLLTPWATERGVALTATGSARAEVDADAVARAVDNLLRNAVEASPSGGRVVAEVRAAEGAVGIEVIDEGPGVAPDRSAELFEPFFTTKPEGTGLGLALARAVAGAHDGTLSYAREGKTTRFTLALRGPWRTSIDSAPRDRD